MIALPSLTSSSLSGFGVELVRKFLEFMEKNLGWTAFIMFGGADEHGKLRTFVLVLILFEIRLPNHYSLVTPLLIPTMGYPSKSLSRSCRVMTSTLFN